MKNKHEYDCEYECVGCERSFCEIKTDHRLNHSDEMPEQINTNLGRYCGSSCFDDNH